MRTWTKISILMTASVLASWGCSSVTDTGGPLSITLSADPVSAQVGQNVTFTYSATGSSISGIILEYGDSGLDSIPSYGSQSAGGHRAHAYSSEGSFTATGTVYDAVQGTTSATAQVTVTAAPGS